MYMRVINTWTYEFHSDKQSTLRQEGYATLSHRWVEPEITYAQYERQIPKLRSADEPTGPRLIPALSKIHGACHTARELGIGWMWIDSCCINKENTVEEAESIYSMFKWYREAKLCITYLSDVRKSKDYSHHDGDMSTHIFQSIRTDGPSIWFSRGWTLQELLAPREMLFYDTYWERLGTRRALAAPLERITNISARYLTGQEDFRSASIATKMSWMAGRVTNRVEDISYSMMGIFNVSMPIQYGEGRHAFVRLQQELLKSSTDESLFAWRMPRDFVQQQQQDVVVKSSSSSSSEDAARRLQPNEWGLLASSPEWFRDSARVTIEGTNKLARPKGGYSITQQGVQGPIPPGSGDALMPVYACLAVLSGVGIIPFVYSVVRGRGKETKFVLNCSEPDEAGKMRAVQIYLRPVPDSPRVFYRTRCHEYELVRKSFSKSSSSGVVHQPDVNIRD